MEDEEPLEAVMWREGNHRCELWAIDAHHELRVYVSDALTHREPVVFETRLFQQSARLLAKAQVAISRSSLFLPDYVRNESATLIRQLRSGAKDVRQQAAMTAERIKATFLLLRRRP